MDLCCVAGVVLVKGRGRGGRGLRSCCTFGLGLGVGQ